VTKRVPGARLFCDHFSIEGSDTALPLESSTQNVVAHRIPYFDHDARLPESSDGIVIDARRFRRHARNDVHEKTSDLEPRF